MVCAVLLSVKVFVPLVPVPHGANAFASTRHEKVAVSSVVQLNVADVEADADGGVVVSVVVGVVLSSVHE